MDRKATIEYMKQAVACDNTSWETCKKYKKCVNCPNHFPVPLIKVVRAALELLEAEGENHELV